MKRLLRALGCVAIILVILILVKNEYARLLMSHANHGLQAVITRAEEEREEGEAEPFDLYIGSSLFRQGLDIEELNENGGNNYILAYNNTQPFLICKEVEYLIEHDVPIGSITADMYIYTTLEDPWIEDTRLLIDTDLGFKMDLWKEMRASSRSSFADLWEMMVTSNNDKLLIWPVDYALVNPMFKDGGNLLVNSGTTQEALNGPVTDAEPGEDGYAFNERQEYYLGRLIDLCEEHGITLTFLEMPKYYTVESVPGYTEMMHLYCNYLKNRGVSYCLTGVTAEELVSKEYDADVDDAAAVIAFDQTNPAYYIDLVHMSSDGRREFTRQYVNAVGQSAD